MENAEQSDFDESAEEEEEEEPDRMSARGRSEWEMFKT